VIEAGNINGGNMTSEEEKELKAELIGLDDWLIKNDGSRYGALEAAILKAKDPELKKILEDERKNLDKAVEARIEKMEKIKKILGKKL
jgi:hypothetical protein